MRPVGIGGVLANVPPAAWARPEAALLVGSMVMAYAVAMGPVRRDVGAPSPGWTGWAAWLGACLALEIALGSPMAYLAAGYLLIAHMLQFVLVSFVAAPLALRAVPPWLWHLVLPPGGLRRTVAWLGGPAPALGFFSLSFLLFQAPTLTDAALRSPALYAAEAAVLMGTSIFLWWPVYGSVLSTASVFPRRAGLGQLLYVFLTGFPGLALAAALVLFATGPVYPGYAGGEHRIGIPPFLDQQLAGILMQVGMTVARGVIFGGIGLAWGARQDAAERETRARIAGRAEDARPLPSGGRARPGRPVALRVRPS